MEIQRYFFLDIISLDPDSGLTNTHQLGNVMYTEYIHLFQISGIILLLSMIGAIVLTIESEKELKDKIILNKFQEREKTL